MKNIAKIGPMYLLEVTAVRARQMPADSVTVFIISFKDCQLAVTGLHAFTCSDDILKNAYELQKGDRIWVDLSAFVADGSFTKVQVSSSSTMVIHHIDGDLGNNNPNNLRLVPLNKKR